VGFHRLRQLHQNPQQLARGTRGAADSGEPVRRDDRPQPRPFGARAERGAVPAAGGSHRAGRHDPSRRQSGRRQSEPRRHVRLPARADHRNRSLRSGHARRPRGDPTRLQRRTPAALQDRGTEGGRVAVPRGDPGDPDPVPERHRRNRRRPGYERPQAGRGGATREPARAGHLDGPPARDGLPLLQRPELDDGVRQPGRARSNRLQRCRAGRQRRGVVRAADPAG